MSRPETLFIWRRLSRNLPACFVIRPLTRLRHILKLLGLRFDRITLITLPSAKPVFL